MAKGPGRPKGARNKATVQVRELARQHAKRAIGALLDITDDNQQSASGGARSLGTR